PAPSVFPDRVPSFLVDEQVKIERIRCRALEKMLGAEPGNLYVAKISFWNRPAFTVDQQVVSAAERKVLNVRHAFPAPRIIVPRLPPHDYLNFICVVEYPVGIAHVGDKNIDMCTLLAQRRSYGVRHIEIVLSINGDENLVARNSLVIADEANMAVAIFAGVRQRSCIWH